MCGADLWLADYRVIVMLGPMPLQIVVLGMIITVLIPSAFNLFAPFVIVNVIPSVFAFAFVLTFVIEFELWIG
ncbi:hypothetical protein DFH09DRAFT_1320570 [Mycena vulgaris]|nr:hypothetical protein DFH09DRAFT_1320494 [Mycena vulgaris]KAJ6548245.1 hypothetical protein DFH09DRAFT_1320570 [Mycena vulgaris]